MPIDKVPHIHKCHLCGAMWSHVQARGVTMREYHKLHNCPNPECDGNQRWIYAYVDETEDFPGQFEDRHNRNNRQVPGGIVGGNKRNDASEDAMVDELIGLMLLDRPGPREI